MPDNLTVTPGAGADIRFRAINGGTVMAQVVDTAPWVESPVGTGGTRFSVVSVTGTTGLSIGTATHVYVSIEPDSSSGLRFWNTGAVPSSTLGHYLAPGAGPVEITNAQLLQCASSGTSGATFQLSCHSYV